MKKLFLISLILIVTTSAFGQFHQKPMLGQQINWAHPLSDFVGAWFFLEGTGNKVFDLSGNNNVGTFAAGAASPSWVPGGFGSVIYFDGGDHIEAPTPITDYPFTIVAWAKAPDNSNIHYIFSINNDGDDNQQCALRFLSDATVAALIRNDSAFETAKSTTSYAANKEHMIAGVFTSSTLRAVYLDAGGVGIDTDLLTTGGNWNMLTWGGLGDNTPTFDVSTISHVLLYNRALPASEIVLLYREPFCMFQQDDIAMMVEAEAPPPSGGQVIIIQAAASFLPFIVILCLYMVCFIKERKYGR